MRFLQNNKQYVKLICANTISRFGDSIDMIGFAWLIYELTQKASWSAIIVGVNQVTSVLVQPVIGSYVENKNKKKIMVISDFLRFFFILMLFLFCRLKLANQWTLIIFTIGISFVEAFRIPAGVSIIPMILNKEDYSKGISINNTLSKGSELLGMFFVGMLINLIGAAGVILLDGFTFLISGMLIVLIKYKDITTIKTVQKNNYFKMTKEAFVFLVQKKKLFIICIVCGLINAGVVPYDSFQAPYINLYFDKRVEILSYMSIAISIGMVLGSAVYHKLFEHKSGIMILSIGGIILGFFYIGLAFAAKINLFIYWKICIIVLLSLVVGIAIAFMNNYVQIFFIKEVDQTYLSRISSVSTTMTNIFSPLAAFLVGIVSVNTEVIQIMIMSGVLIILCFSAAGFLLNYYDNKEKKNIEI